MKGLEDSDYGLVSNKTLSQKICSHDRGPGPDDLDHKGLNLSHL